MSYWANKLVGQRKQFIPLIESIKDKLFSHAILIEGQSGHGSLAFALGLVEQLMCDNPGEQESCGSCHACRKIESLEHPDVHFVFPVVKKSDKNRADTLSDDFISEWRKHVKSNPYSTLSTWIQSISDNKSKGDINVKECNSIISKLGLQSFRGKNKILVIWMAELLGKEGNRLLKTIEEPPPNTFVILICESSEHLLKTIYSRCQHIKLNRLDMNEVSDYLINEHHIDRNKAEKISFIADGSISDATSLLELEDDLNLKMFLSLLEFSFKSELEDIRTWVDQFAILPTESQKVFFNYILRILRESIHLRILGPTQTKLPENDLNFISQHKILMNLELDDLQKMSQMASEAIDLIDRNINIKIMMFNFALNLELQLNRGTETAYR